MKLIRISAVWCPACLIMRPRINRIVEEFHLESVEYDYDFNEDIVSTYEVGLKLPVFILVDHEKEITRIIGEKTEEEIRNTLKGFVK